MGRYQLIAALIVILLVGGAASFVNWSALFPFRFGLDLQGGVSLVYQADLSKISSQDYDEVMAGLRDVIERRVNLFGVTEPVVQTEGRGEEGRLIVELAGIKDPNQAIQIIGQTPFLQFRETKENYQQAAEQNEDPFQDTELTGKYLKKAQVGFDSVTNAPLIQLEFNDEGAKLFEEITARNVGKPLAIFLDYQLLQAPVVQEVISSGQAQISGSFTPQKARELVRALNAGALPVPITLISQQSVGPTLGQVSLEQSLRAGVAGFGFVLLYMLIFYRLPGLVASLALLWYIAVVLAVFKLIPITLSLAGIGGFILSIGMAVDANILVFARMKEELRSQKSFTAALEQGFSRAWPSIRDGNGTTLLVAFILFQFGSSFVKGFAVALSIGIIVSMISALMVTRVLLRLLRGTILERIVKI
ncbi:MAG: Preprotein translocase subunit SecD [Parcubacteria group bacterium GW2011_GWA1_53_13]|nr:MAG: Preprotein translocase subunit SecD [Parcubacteria group bacterium GW2011_GWA1_53_13]